MNIRDEMIDEMAENIRQEIDNELMTSMLVMNGWTVVKLERFKDMKHPIDVNDWCDKNIGSRKYWTNFGPTYLFKESKHAEWFSLRWL
jgi:hypothetical protein